MALNLGGLLAGAGVVGQAMRQEEEAQRVARQNQLKIEEQNRLELLRQQQAKSAAPEAVRMTDVFGVAATGLELIPPRQFMVRLSMSY